MRPTSRRLVRRSLSLRTAATVLASVGLVAPIAPGAASATDATVRYLSDLAPTYAANGYGPYERDRANGGKAAKDGPPLRLDGRQYVKGLGVHAVSDLRYTVPSGCTSFSATAGVDDSQGTRGSVVFQVVTGGRTAWQSARVTGAALASQLTLPVTAGSSLRLVVLDGGNGKGYDHADWADARFLCGTTAPIPSPTTPPTTPSTTPTVFPKADAFWQPVPTTSPRLDPASGDIVAKLSAAGAARVALLHQYGSPIVEATASTPRYQLNVRYQGTGPGQWGYNDLGSGTVPLPDGAVPSTGTDGKLTVVDWSTRQVYDLWQLERTGDTWTVGWGGVYPLDGDGSSRNPAYQGPNAVAWPQPVSRGTGSGIASSLGTIRMAEVAAGSIPHAVAITTDMACGPANTGPFRWPATTTDGSVTSGTCIPQGARVQLDPSVDLSAIAGISKGELALGRALQTYGGIVNDIGGSRMSFYFEKPQPGQADPYAAAGLTYDYFAFDKLPWHRLRVLASWNGA